jgi:hypothetical protein
MPTTDSGARAIVSLTAKGTYLDVVLGDLGLDVEFVVVNDQNPQSESPLDSS